MQVEEDSHATYDKKRQRKIVKIQLTQTEKLIGANWRVYYKNQSYDLDSSIRRIEKKDS